MVKVWYICDEGLAISMETGSSSDGTKYDKVANMQSAIKFLVKSKDVMACKVTDIEIYELGVTKADYTTKTPLKPEDKIPEGSTQRNAIFVHVPRDVQDLTPEERRLYANPRPSANKPMARPKIERLVMNPKKKKKPKPKKPEKKQVEVTVRCADGTEFKKIIDPKHNISDLKNQFGLESGVPASQQILSKDGKELDDNKTAAESGIKNGDIIDLAPKPITVQVKCPDGKKIPVTMKLSDTTLFIKENCADESGIEVPRQCLKYHDEEMEDGKTAKDMGLQDGSILDLSPKTIRIKVKCPDGKLIPVEMKPSDDMLFVKEKCEPESGIPVYKQLLKKDGKELPEEKTAKECGLKDGDVIDLRVPTITVKVMTPKGKILPVTMEPTDNIQFIKEKVEPDAGIPVKDQRLIFNENELDNDKSADDCGLKDGDIIDLRGPGGDTDDEGSVGSTEFPVAESKDYSIPFEGTPMDLTRFRAWFMVADTVPFEMICPIAMTIKEFKVEILKIRNDARFVKKYFEGLEDPDEIKIYPAGSWGEGDPLPEDIPVPKDSSEYAFFSVFR